MEENTKASIILAVLLITGMAIMFYFAGFFDRNETCRFKELNIEGCVDKLNLEIDN